MNLFKSYSFQAAVFLETLQNKEAKKAIELLEKANNLDKNGILELRQKAFEEMISYALTNSTYYKNVAQEYGLKPSDFKTIEDLNKLPLLTKDIIKAKRIELVVTSIPDDSCITRTSGGTTGEPIYIQVDKQCRTNELYFYYRGLNWMGWKPGYQMVKLFGGSLSGNNTPNLRNKMKKVLSGEVFLPAFNLNYDTADEYLKIIKVQGPTFIQGYVSSIYNLAVLIKEKNYKGIQIIGAFTTAEQLPIEQAEFIKDVLGCDVKSFYGCAEINCLGFQQTMGGPYIIPDEIVYIENTSHPELPLNNAFLLTSLFNKKTPLLRYLNGDNGVLGQSHSKYSTIDELSGRTADMFIKPDGSIISSIVATQTMQITGLTHRVKLYQLVQDAPDHIWFKYEPFDDLLTNNELKTILDMYKKRMGKEFTIEGIQTNDFIKSSSGKHRLMIKQI